MLFLLDANSIIDAKDKYYAIDRVPEYWEWLLHHAKDGRLKMPFEIFEEVSPGRDKEDPFYVWRKDSATSTALLLDEEADPVTVEKVLDEGYGFKLTDNELITIGKIHSSLRTRSRTQTERSSQVKSRLPRSNGKIERFLTSVINLVSNGSTLLH